MRKLLFYLIITLAIVSCSKENTELDDLIKPTPEEPSTPEEPIVTSDTLVIPLNMSLDVTEKPLTRTTSNSKDLIGVEIYKVLHGWSYNFVTYAVGVFDDVEQIKFKFVKDTEYMIQMNYYPNAKDFVYEYSDGTFGAPFSYLYGLKEYTLNEPVYYSGTEGGWSGDAGATLSHLMGSLYQPTEDRYTQSFKLSTTDRYLGEIESVVINENTKSIVMPLQLCMMGITMNVGNFTEGKLDIDFVRYDYKWQLKSGDTNNTIKFQIPYNTRNINGEGHYYETINSGEEIKVYYTNDNDEKYLLAMKNLLYKPGTNYVFNFDITEREDGSIGIQIPDGSYTDEETTFD